MTSQLYVAMIRKLLGSIMYVVDVLDVFSMSICTAGHWKTSGRLVQELNVCTVACEMKYIQWCGHPCIRAKETKWQSGVRLYIMPGLTAHLVQ